MKVMLKVSTINDIRNKEQIKTALIDLSSFDCDWSGENGPGYLRKEADNAGYDDNASYFADKFVKQLPEDNVFDAIRPVVDAYVNAWMGHDTYYLDYEIEVTRASVGDAVISLACAVED